MQISIREYTESDYRALSSMSDDVWSTKIACIAAGLRNYDGKIERCYLAEKNGIIVGFIYGHVLPNRLLFPELLYVLPEYRNKGIATKLLDEFEKTSGCTTSLIFYNKALHDFYFKRDYCHGENLEVAMKLIPCNQEEQS